MWTGCVLAADQRIAGENIAMDLRVIYTACNLTSRHTVSTTMTVSNREILYIFSK